MLRLVPWYLLCLSLLAQSPILPEARQFAAKVVAAPDAAARAILYQRLAPLTPPQVYLAINALADGEHRKGLHDRELEVGRIELEFARFTNDDAVLMQAYRDIGLAFEDMAQLDASTEAFLAALAVPEKYRPPARTAVIMSHLAAIEQRKTNHAEAVQWLEKALAAAPADDAELQAMFGYSLGQAYLNQGQFRKALDSLQRSLAISERNNNVRGIAYSTNAIGSVYYEQRDAEMAATFHRRSLEVKQKARMTRDLTSTLNNLALDYLLTNQTQEAQSAIDQAMRYIEPDSDNAAVAIYNTGYLLAGQGKVTAAIDKFRQSLTIARKLGSGDQELESLASIGRCQLESGDVEAGYTTLNEAVQRMAELGDTAHNLRIPIYYATALVRKNRLKEAEAGLLQAAAAFEENESRLVGGAREQALFVDGSVDPYRPLMDLYAAQGRTEEALAAAERGRAHVLLDALGGRGNSITGSMSAEEKKQERELARRLVAAGNQTRPNRGGPRRSSDPGTGARLDKARAEYRIFLADLFLRHPELSTQRGLPVTLTRERLAALVDGPHSALLEYVVGDSQSHLFVVRRNPSGALSLSVVPIKVERQQLAGRILKLHNAIEDRNLDYRDESRALYRLLLEPASAQLGGITSLVIVPDRSLWQLPFAALLRPNGHHLGDDVSLSFAPSLAALEAMKRLDREHGAGRRTLLALGNPEGLPDAEREVRAVEQIYGKSNSTVFVGAAATEEVFKSQAGNYDIIHTATHGVFNNRGPMYSLIELAKPKQPGGAEDGMLEAWELLGLKLHAELAVLSACESGRGQPGAEGLVGMTWALFVAGVPSVVASRWKVDSAATSEFMIAFHRELKRTGNKADSLRLAALHLKRNAAWRHPAYWSAFMLVGSSR
ncbi:MAG: CHAT domain-containing protein [Acidobacteria bacterium]|nr:CHAT domain-containing protein [Acidobacteriota bacterium]